MGLDGETLTLGLAFSLSPQPNSHSNSMKSTLKPPELVDDHQDHPSLTLTLTLSPDTYPVKKKLLEEPPCTAASTPILSVKRERDTASSDDFDTDPTSYRPSDEEEDGSGATTPAARKKLRLTKQQSAFLEESFKQHSTLNPKQKQSLADRLNLRPRQVEVWFQNRRARTKLKQTEVDCEYLKKWCETLTDENRRLQKELQELKALKVGQPLYMHLPAATLSMCPSCERIGGAAVPIASATPSNSGPFSMASNPPFFTSFPKPSAAC